MRRTIIIWLMLLSMMAALAQAVPTQTIRGSVVEQASGESLPFATIKIIELPERGVVADENGRFSIPDVPIGRYTLECSMPGYSSVILKEQMLSSAKEMVVEFALDEELNVLNISAKYTFQGPERTSPIDYAATEAHPDHEVQYVEDQLFTVKLGIEPAYAFSASFKINCKKIAHCFVLDFFHTVSFFGYKYNQKTGAYDEDRMGLSIPQIAYRIEF